MRYRMACLFLLILSSLPAGEPVTLLTEDVAPFNYPDPADPLRITGVCTEAVRLIMERSGQPQRIHLMPWARAYAQLKAGPRVALFATARLPEREALFQWVGPLASKHLAFVVPAGSGLRLESLEDARRASAIAVYRDSAKERWLATRAFANLERVDDDPTALRLLLGGRIPLWFTAEPECHVLAAQQGVAPTQLAIALRAERIDLYLAVSRDVEADTVAQWQRRCDELRQDGTLAALTARFIPAGGGGAAPR